MTKRLGRTEKETIIKLLLCTVISFCISPLVGRTYSPTIAVTSNLFLYTDRGYFGGIRYAVRRILVQAIQGAFVLPVILLLRFWLKLPIPDPLLLMIASCIALVLGLPLNYRHTYSPFVCTLANATYIIACAAIQSPTAYFYRVLECILGFFIGYTVNHLIMPQRDRYSEAILKKEECTRRLLDGDTNAEYQTLKRLLQVDIGYLKEDSKKGLKRHHLSSCELEAAALFQKLLGDMEDYQAKLKQFGGQIPGGHMAEIQRTVKQANEMHLCLMDDYKNQRYSETMPAELPVFRPESNEETVLWACVIVYLHDLNHLLALNRGEPAASPQPGSGSPQTA